VSCFSTVFFHSTDFPFQRDQDGDSPRTQSDHDSGFQLPVSESNLQTLSQSAILELFIRICVLFQSTFNPTCSRTGRRPFMQGSKIQLQRAFLERLRTGPATAIKADSAVEPGCTSKSSVECHCFLCVRFLHGGVTDATWQLVDPSA
jgi:hypothetical protein